MTVYFRFYVVQFIAYEKCLVFYSVRHVPFYLSIIVTLLFTQR